MQLVEENPLVLDDDVISTPRVAGWRGEDRADLPRIDALVNAVELRGAVLPHQGYPHLWCLRRFLVEPAPEGGHELGFLIDPFFLYPRIQCRVLGNKDVEIDGWCL